MVPGTRLWFCCRFYCWWWKLWCYLSLLPQFLLECESWFTLLIFFLIFWISCITISLFQNKAIVFYFYCIAVCWGSSSPCWLWNCGQVDTEEQRRVWKYELVYFAILVNSKSWMSKLIPSYVVSMTLQHCFHRTWQFLIAFKWYL